MKELNTAEKFVLDPIVPLNRDIKKASSATLTLQEIRYLVDTYYSIQDSRKRSALRLSANKRAGSKEPMEIVEWLETQMKRLENQIKGVLDKWTDSNPTSVWAKSICGIGPVISAGLAAHIDISKAPYAGNIWSFAGLDPKKIWKKKEKRPWNAKLKVLCWKIGESFVKVSGKEDDIYGKLYLKRKELEESRNENFEFKEQAEVKAGIVRHDTEAYKYYIQGKLPPGHIHSRAKRVAVKLFLAHYHEVAMWIELHKKAPEPYVFVHEVGHSDYFPPPNFTRVASD